MDHPGGEWWQSAFDALYPGLYAHRSPQEATAALAAFAPHLPRMDGSLCLDIGCGQGRYLRALRENGAAAIGLDYSLALLRVAREEQPGAPLVRGDMRDLPFRSGSATIALSMFTSFGYFASDAENEAVIREIGRVLAPGGRVLLDYLNAAQVRSSLVPVSSRVLGEARLDERRWVTPDGRFLCKETRVWAAETPPRVILERVRLYTPEDLTAMASSAGLATVRVFGDYGAEPFELTASPRWILVAEKEGGSS